jgi:hypothetical protein
MAVSGKIVDLRKLLAERFPHPKSSASAKLITGLSFFDATIAGGLPKAAITELITPQISAGSASLITALIQTAYRHRYFIALIDGRDSFDPGPLANSCLRHLLWVRCTTALEVIKAADLLLRDGNFPLVMADLVLNPLEEVRKIPQTTWYRLQRLVEPTSTAFLVLTRGGVVSSAQLKIVLENAWTLKDLDQEHALSSLRPRVQRSHVHETAIAMMEAS